LKDLNRESQN